MNKILISPSILSADFAVMGESAKDIEKCGADMIHCDVMDGVFVPNITFGMKMVADIKRRVNIPLDVHLMIINPENYVKQFIDAGADYVTIHIEATKNVAQTLKLIRESGAKAGLSVKPNTPVAEMAKYIDLLDLILIMSVEPGFGGQKFMPNAVNKLAEAKTLIGSRDVVLQVDGGINTETAKLCVDAGATSLVAGNAVFKAENKAEMIIKLRG